jgi:hypothetical protein
LYDYGGGGFFENKITRRNSHTFGLAHCGGDYILPQYNFCVVAMIKTTTLLFDYLTSHQVSYSL